MRFANIGLSFLALIIATASTPITFRLWASPGELRVLAQTPADRKAEADRLFEQGNEQYQTSQFEAALKSWQQALIIYRQIKDRKGEGQSLGNLGIAYFNLGDYTKAIDYQQQRLEIARAIKDRQGEGHSLGNLGNAYNALGEYTKAIDYYQQSLAIAREIKDRQGEGAALGNLGNAYDALGDYTKAIDYQQQRLEIARAIKDRKGEGQSLGNLGNAYYVLGDYSKAINYYSKRLAIALEIKDRKGEGNALGNLGNAYNALGEYTKAIDYHSKRLAIALEIKDRHGQGQSLGNLGNAYYALGDYTKAIDYHSKRLAIALEIKDRLGEGNALGNLGNAYHALGDYTKAIDYHSKRLAIVREIKDRLGEGNALGNLGNAYSALGEYTKAIDYHSKSLAIALEIKDRKGEGNALNNLGFAYQKSGNLKVAETTLRTGIEVWESFRERLGENDSYKVSIFEEQARTYRQLQQVLIALNKTNEALEISERGRSRAFVELLTTRLSNNTAPQPSEKPTISLLQQIAKQQNATLVEYSIVYDDFKIQGKREIKELELYIWVIKPTGEVTFRKADLKPLWQKENTTLAQLVTQSRESISVRGRGITVTHNPNRAKVKQRFQKLHELLINPIADLLPKNPDERVTFIPQSSLFLVPFAALQDDQGKYLIEKHTILTAPAIQVLDLTRQQRQRVLGNQALVMGNPTMPSVPPKVGEAPQQLPDLPGAETEAKEISQLLNTKAITGKDATKAAFVQRLPQARFIHLATHGLLDDFKGLGVPGAVALAPNGKDNGLLTANEIIDLKINAELVVLSACDTAQGKLTGDGVIGLSRALISAGAPSVIVTLWSIPDSPSALLMGEFYRQLQKNPDKAQALRQAMLTTMKQHPSPSAWAAFTLIGEAK
ncbi:tetratricopeptide repeat protein [Tolypothrix sp. PCC 7910]|uniref:CHAT domain-containing protein n=1 Tax=Tolypothrix sp. PCC 7910 TaxID=2099387 RepID=UPI0014279BBF|nr:CHAT domain-containing tetratricopeptide repeat protein [Tolypothrix sp. PCC 7910]QIR40031.1 tetratricopeptide repeat protein [Tolypothrix sp. PCC 7910]